MQMMQRRTAAAEHALKKAELRVRSAELRAQSAESELAQLRKAHAVSAHAVFHDVCNVAGASTAICTISSAMCQMKHQMSLDSATCQMKHQMSLDVTHMHCFTFCSIALLKRKAVQFCSNQIYS